MTEKRKWAVKVGSVTIWIRLQRPSKNNPGYRCYTLDYTEDGRRQRPSCATLQDAKREAKAVAQPLSRGDTGSIVLTGNARLDFYGDPALERWLSNEIEGPGAAAIQALLERRELSTDQIKAFFVFVAAQMQRTPANLERMASTFAPEFQEITERMAKYDQEFRSNVLAAARAAGDSDAEIEEFKKLLDEGTFQVEPAREFTIGAAFQVLELLANELRKMCWTFLEVYVCFHSDLVADWRFGVVEPNFYGKYRFCWSLCSRRALSGCV